MLGRRLFALHCNIATIASKGRTYLWTFTRKEAEDYPVMRAAWQKLLTYLRRWLPDFQGVRVYEVHPGKWGEFSHGLHVHALCTRQYDVELIRSIARGAGWGRINVVRVKKGKENYVAKYLGKKRPEALKGWRLWATFNMGNAKTRVADVVVASVRASLMRLVHVWHKSARWNEKQDIVRAWYERWLSDRWCSAVQVALLGKHRFIWQRSRRGWVPDTRETFQPRDLRWGFFPVQSRLATPAFDPFATCWGADVRKTDLGANRAAEKGLRRSTSGACPFGTTGGANLTLAN